jgi:hypothetical protein
MTTEVTPETVSVELSVEAAYEQLVSFETAVKAFNEADEKDDADGRLSAANDAVDSCITLINDLVPRELSNQLHERLEKEHPELVPEEDPILAAIRAMLAGMDESDFVELSNGEDD